MFRETLFLLLLAFVPSSLACTLRASRSLQDWQFDYTDGPNGPATWGIPERNNSCAGKAQSPVNIPNTGAFTTKVLGNIDAFGFSYTEPVRRQAFEVEFENMGATVELLFHGLGEKLSGAAEFTKILGRNEESSGENEDEFTLEQLHFHWGNEDDSGSEHAYGRKQFPLEMHLVHYNSGKYADLTEAAGHQDGLLVVGVMFEVGASSTGDLLAPLAEVIRNERFNEADIHHVDFDLLGMTEQLNTGAFYLYAGSLTTPPCSEVVTWVLLKEPLSISAEVMDAFRSVEKEEGEIIGPNYRPLQSGNSRIVFDVETQMAATIADIVSEESLEERRQQQGVATSVEAVVAVGVLLAGLLFFMHKSKGDDN